MCVVCATKKNIAARVEKIREPGSRGEGGGFCRSLGIVVKNAAYMHVHV